MALKESLDGVSASLAGILSQLKEIETTQKSIVSNADAYKRAVAGSAGGMGTGGVGASPGTMDGSLAPVSAAAGGGGGNANVAARGAASGAMGGGFGAKALGFGLGAGAIGIDTLWNMTPGVQDYLSYQGTLFQTARYGATGYDPNVSRRVKASFGPYMTSNTDALAAAQIATMRGQGISSGVFDFQMRQSASISMLTGMSNPQAAQAATSMYMGSTSGNLARYGIFTNNLKTGAPRDLGAIVDELWARWFGSKNKAVDMAELNAQLMGGFVGNDLRNLFGNDPALYQTMYSLILQKGQMNGKSVRLNKTSGRGSAIDTSIGLGNNRQNNPMLGLMEMSSSRYSTLEATAGLLSEGFQSGVDTVKFLNEQMQNLATASGELGDAFRALLRSKAFIETVTGTSEGGAVAGGLGSLVSLLGGVGAGVLGKSLLSKLFGTGGGASTAAKGAEAASAASKVGLGSKALSLAGKAFWPIMLGEMALRGGDDLLQTWQRNDLSTPQKLLGSYLSMNKGVYDTVGEPLSWLGINLPNVQLAGNNAKGTIGGTGSSTSDNIRANLSRGEYVINARAAQSIGTRNLDALNALGQDFGSAYASPAKNMAKGGDTTSEGFPVLPQGDSRLRTYSVGKSGSVTLNSDYASVLLGVINAYASDPVLAPIKTLGSYEYRQKYNPETGAYDNGWSQHAAGVAVDINEDDWGMPPGRSATPSELKAVERILAANPGATWGGSWTGAWRDPMHWEVKDPGTVAPAGATTTGTAPKSTSRTRRSAAQGTIGPAPAGANIIYGPSALSTAATTLGGTTGFIKGYSLPGIGASSKGLAANFTTSAPISARLASIVSKVSGSAVMGGLGASSASSSTPRSRADIRTANSDSSVNYNNAATGKGPEWLYQFLVDHGLRGNDLHTAWTIAMRESGGDPGNTTNGGKENWKSSGYPHYDVGVFQINNRHLDAIRQMFGNDADMSLMLDPNKNFEYMMRLSKNLTSLYAWALEPDGRTFNWDVSYGGRSNYSYADSAESNHMTFWNEYSKYNKYNYSQGAYRTHEGTVKVHEGEMIMPASAAEEFRKVMRDFSMGGNRGGDVNITLKIDKASDAEAERFAKKVKKILSDDDYLSSMRKR